MAGGGAPKSDEPTPHPPKDQLPNVSYCITSPPPWRKIAVFRLIDTVFVDLGLLFASIFFKFEL